MSTVPLPLTLPETPREVKRYQRRKLVTHLASAALSLAFLLVMAAAGGPALDAWLRDWLGDGPWLRLLAVAGVVGVGLELLTLPLSYWSGFVLEHRHHLSNQTLRAWAWRQCKGYLVGGVLGLVLLYGFYGVLQLTGPWWWLWAALAWLVVSVLLGQLLPVLILPLFFKVTRLEDAELQQRLARLAEGTGLTLEGVYRLHLSADTRKANAALAGLGSTRRVLLGDTLLDKFSPEEIEVVFAHEVGHHVHRHILKMVALSAVLATAGFWLVDVVGRALAPRLGYESFTDPAALPLVMVVLALFGLVLMPLQHAISRHFERQCDRYALDRTGLRDAYRAAFVKLAVLNKSDPDPHPLALPARYRRADAAPLALCPQAANPSGPPLAAWRPDLS
jgi:STE24 endopeptidase